MIKQVGLLFLFFLGCASNEVCLTQFPIPISEYFSTINGNQTHFVIQFQQPIPDKIKLEKLYFRNQTAEIKMISNQTAEAVFIKRDLILDANPEKEYGNQRPIPQKQSFKLNSTEAVIEFTQNGKIKHYKFTDVAEKSNN